MITATVPFILPNASQLTRDFGCPGGTWPDTMVKSWFTPRWVTGMPADAGTEIADVMPGTSVTGMPASRSATSSSKPRPNRYGSPPLRRTTNNPCLARSTSSALMRSCAIARP